MVLIVLQAIVSGVVFAAAILAFGTATATEPSITVTGVIEAKHMQLALSQLDRLPRRSALVTTDAGRHVRYEGADLRSVLATAGVRFGESLGGARLSMFLLAEGHGGLKVVFSLPELDPSFGAGAALLVWRKDGRRLPPGEGVFRIVLPGEMRQDRWLKDVRTLRLARAEDLNDE